MSSTSTYLIQRVVKQAVDLFKNIKNYEPVVFNEGLNQLINLANQLTADEAGFDEKWLANADRYKPNSGIAPVTYVGLYESDIVSIGMFILKTGYKMPIHDHPNMYGIMKILHGKLCMTSYGYVTNDDVNGRINASGDSKDTRDSLLGRLYHCTRDIPRIVTADDRPCVLTPSHGNIHEVAAVDGPTAFLDILAPPYDNVERPCSQFKELSVVAVEKLCNEKVRNDRDCWLMMVNPNRSDYWCDSATYKGPSLDHID